MEKTTAFYTWVPFEYQQSPKFEIVFAYQLFSCWVYGFFIGAIDTILTGFMIHIKCQCLILKNSIRRYNLLEETNGDVSYKLLTIKIFKGNHIPKRIVMFSCSNYQTLVKIIFKC